MSYFIIGEYGVVGILDPTEPSTLSFGSCIQSWNFHSTHTQPRSDLMLPENCKYLRYIQDRCKEASKKRSHSTDDFDLTKRPVNGTWMLDVTGVCPSKPLPPCHTPDSQSLCHHTPEAEAINTKVVEEALGTHEGLGGRHVGPVLAVCYTMTSVAH